MHKYQMCRLSFRVWLISPMVALTTLVLLYSQSQLLSSCKAETLLLLNHSIFPLTARLAATVAISVTGSLTALGTSCIWSHTEFVLRLASFIKHSAISDQPCGSLCLNFFLFKPRLIFHCRLGSRCVHPSIP